MTGGYIMIDCHGLDLLSESSQTISGLYSDIQTAMRIGKPIYAYNVNWGTLAITPIHVFAIQLTSTTVTCTASTLQVVITSDDAVTVNNLVG